MNKITPTSVDRSGDLPYCIQGSEAPAFRGELASDKHLMCSAECGQMLIEHYAKYSYASIGIKCFRCGEITRTPGLELGEVFAASVGTLGNKGAFLLGSTVNVRSGVVLTCDQEIARAIEATAPRSNGLPLDLSEVGLKNLETLYNSITGCELAKQQAIVRRKGIPSILIYPFAWAVSHIENCLKERTIDLTKRDTLTALMWLHRFCHVVGIWQHHPRFQAVAKDLGKPRSFLHTTAQLLAAAYLYEAGNRIGLSLEDQHGEPNPDLYIRGDVGSNIFLEVKAPEALQWRGDDQESIASIETAVKNCIKRSRGQINRSHRGALIISSSLIWEDFPTILERSIQKAMRSEGRNRKSLAAVVGLSTSRFLLTKQNGNKTKLDAGFKFSVTLNEYYDGENPIKTVSPSL